MSVRAPVGPINFATQEICIGRGLAAIRVSEHMNRDFLFYQLLFKQNEISGKEGAVFPSINRAMIGEFQVVVPPLKEQQRIVSILDQAFHNIENRTSQAEHKLHNSKEMFQSVATNIFFPKGEDWTEKCLGDICEILDKLRKPITKRDRVSGEYPYYGATGIVDYVNDYIFDEKLVLIGEDGAKWESGENTAFAVDGKCWVNNHAHVIRPDRTIVLDNWLIYFLNISDLTPHITGLTVPKLNQGKLRAIQIPIAPLNQQQNIVRKLDSLSQNVALLEENHRSEIESLVELKQSILQEAFSGKLTGGIAA
jgi:type I restriction enzyme S subunit